MLFTGAPPCAAVAACPSASWRVRGLRATGADKVREYAGHRRQAADVAVDHAEQRDDGGLVGGDAVEIAHRGVSSPSLPQPNGCAVDGYSR